MSSITAQQTKLDLELVPKEKRLEIGKCNGRLNPGKKQREPTFQVVLDALALTPCYYAFLTTVDVPEFEISSWRGARVGVRTYLLGGAIDGSEANGIIRDPKLELESSRFTFDLVPLSYESVDVVIGENWLLRHKAEMVCHEKVVKMPWSCKVRVGLNGNLLWEASVLLGRKKGGVRVAREDDRGVTEGREDVREVFQQRGSGAKRKLSRCGRNQMGFGSMLGKREKVISCTSRQLKVLMKDWHNNVAYTTKYSIHPGADTMLCGFRLTNRWLSMKKDIASCGSKYLAYSEVEVEYQGSSGLLLQPELPE
ncbi:hypothetical protein Tco_0000368 [Tanacetum coccineum]